MYSHIIYTYPIHIQYIILCIIIYNIHISIVYMYMYNRMHIETRSIYDFHWYEYESLEASIEALAAIYQALAIICNTRF